MLAVVKRICRHICVLLPLLLTMFVAGCASTGRVPLSQQALEWRNWPLERKIAQMLLLGFPGETVTESSPIVVAIRDYGVGGVVLFDNNADLGVTERNITSPQQLRRLTSDLQQAAGIPLFIAVDQEGGVVARLKDRYEFPLTYSAAYLGEKNDLSVTAASSAALADTLKDFGFNMNLAPVVDLASNPANPVIAMKQRSFSADPVQVAAHAAEFIKSHRSRKIITCLKHFPVHGSSREDSHHGLVDVTKFWSEKELLPYRYLLDKGLGDMVMTAHTFNTSLDPEYPATLSQKTVDGILRKRLGFEEMVVSDDLYMGAIVQHYSYETAVEKALHAGVDLLVVANDKLYNPEIAPRTIALIKQLVDNGRVSRERIDQACGRIIALKLQYLDR